MAALTLVSPGLDLLTLAHIIAPLFYISFSFNLPLLLEADPPKIRTAQSEFKTDLPQLEISIYRVGDIWCRFYLVISNPDCHHIKRIW